MFLWNSDLKMDKFQLKKWNKKKSICKFEMSENWNLTEQVEKESEQ